MLFKKDKGAVVEVANETKGVGKGKKIVGKILGAVGLVGAGLLVGQLLKKPNDEINAEIYDCTGSDDDDSDVTADDSDLD